MCHTPPKQCCLHCYFNCGILGASRLTNSPSCRKYLKSQKTKGQKLKRERYIFLSSSSVAFFLIPVSTCQLSQFFYVAQQIQEEKQGLLVVLGDLIWPIQSCNSDSWYFFGWFSLISNNSFIPSPLGRFSPYLPVHVRKISFTSSKSFNWMANLSASGWHSNLRNIARAVLSSRASSGSAT